jgi:hypothetical protein
MKTNKFARSFIIILPVIIFVFSSICLLILTGLKTAIYLAFNKISYWDLTNEWDQIVMEAEEWYHYWQTGKS